MTYTSAQILFVEQPHCKWTNDDDRDKESKCKQVNLIIADVVKLLSFILRMGYRYPNLKNHIKLAGRIYNLKNLHIDLIY